MIKLTVRMLLGGRLFQCFLACLIPMLLPWVLRLAPIRFGVFTVLVMDAYTIDFSLPMTALSLLTGILVSDPMTVKLAGFFLALSRDPENLPSPLTVTDCFGPDYLRLLLGMLGRTVRIYAWSIVPILVGALIPGTWEMVQLSGEQVLRITDRAYPFILAGSILSLYRSLSYAMVPYLLQEDPQLSPGEAIRRSIAMTKGRIWELVMLELSFFGWLMLVTMTFGIAYVYVLPYMEGTMAAYYIAFSQPMPWEEKAQIEDSAAG